MSISVIMIVLIPGLLSFVVAAIMFFYLFVCFVPHMVTPQFAYYEQYYSTCENSCAMSFVALEGVLSRR